MVLVSHTSLSASVTLPCLAPAGTAYPPVPHMPTCDSPLDVLVKRGQLTRPSFEVPRTFGVSHLPGSLSMSERPRGPDDKLHHVRMRPAPLDPPPPFPLRMSTVPPSSCLLSDKWRAVFSLCRPQSDSDCRTASAAMSR